MYPSLSCSPSPGSTSSPAAAVFERHNDYIVDYCSVAPERLVGIGCLPIPDVDACAGRAARGPPPGGAGLLIPAHVAPDQPYHHPDYDRFWAALQDIGLPLTMHIFTGTDFDCGLADHWGAAGRHHQGLHAWPTPRWPTR